MSKCCPWRIRDFRRTRNQDRAPEDLPAGTSTSRVRTCVYIGLCVCTNNHQVLISGGELRNVYTEFFREGRRLTLIIYSNVSLNGAKMGFLRKSARYTFEE